MDQINNTQFQFKINHRNWVDALEEAFSLLITVSPGEVVSIIGPSRVGKTRLIKELRQLLDQGNDFDETGLLTSIGVRAVNAGPKGAFSTKDFIYRLLEEVKHPIYSSYGEYGDDENLLAKLDAIPERTLRKALERGIILRGVRYIFIDEAQHVKYVTKDAMAPSAVMDSWKCLAEDTESVLVVVGAYPILNTMLNSPHLLGRKYQVHMPRYYLNEDDLLQFQLIIKAFEESMNIDRSIAPLHKNKDVIALLYEGSLGCIGLLRAWLLHAHAKSLVKKCPVNKAILQMARKSLSDYDSIAKEIYEGEDLVKQIEEKTGNNKNTSQNKKNQNKNSKGSDSKTGRKSTGKPFQRKPQRMAPGHRT